MVQIVIQWIHLWIEGTLFNLIPYKKCWDQHRILNLLQTTMDIRYLTRSRATKSNSFSMFRRNKQDATKPHRSKTLQKVIWRGNKIVAKLKLDKPVALSWCHVKGREKGRENPYLYQLNCGLWFVYMIKVLLIMLSYR